MEAMIFSSLNATLGPPSLSSSNLSNSSLYPLLVNCFWSNTNAVVFNIFTITNILLLPLYTLVVYMGVRRWRRQRSGLAGRLMNHSDLFTYHMVIVESISVLGLLFYCYGMSIENVVLTVLGNYVFFFIFPGQSLFHCLTCVEHYLAVIHPITYLHLREPGGVRIRRVCIGCVWLLCFGLTGVKTLNPHSFPTVLFLCLLSSSITIELFCSLSVLRALIGPRPGNVGGDRDDANQKKHRAFSIITAILGVQLLWFVGLFVCVGLSDLLLLPKDSCVLLSSGVWLTLPSKLVHPLLFLHRAGKLPCYRQSNESG